MAQIFYTTMPGTTNSDEQLATIDDLMHSTVTVYKYNEVQDNILIVDDGDVFQCGKCGNKFSFAEFVLHKKNTCLGPLVDLSNPIIPGRYQIESERTSNVGETRSPLILDNSYSLEHEDDHDPLDVNLSESVRSFSAENSTDPIPSEGLEELKNYALDHDSSFEDESVLDDNFLPETKPFLQLSNVEVPPLDGYDLKNDSYVNSLKDELDIPGEGPVKEQNAVKLPKQTLSPLKCTYCGKEFKKSFDLKQHLRSHTGERPFLCVVCGRAFTQKSNVMKHMSTHRVWPKKPGNIPSNPFVTVKAGGKDSKELVSADITSFSCQYCSDVFKTYYQWKSHLKTHNDKKVFRCIQKSCGLTFPDVDNFLKHININHCDHAQYTCHTCQEEFTSLEKLGLHKCTDNNNKVVKKLACRTCGVRYLKGKEHTCKDYPCPVCNRPFFTERFLRRHLPVHNTASTHVCPVCNKAFKSAKLLSFHQVIHSNYKPHVCRTCSAAFARRGKLTRHYLTHESSKEFKCPFSKSHGCTKEFNRKDKLKTHIAVHDPLRKNKKTQLQETSSSIVDAQSPAEPLPNV